MKNTSPTKAETSRTSKSENRHEDCSNVFNCRPKPILYIKGDTTLVSEISEDSMNSRNGGGLGFLKEAIRNDMSNSIFNKATNKKEKTIISNPVY